ncbi:MAG: glycoside hydrolase family 172 protein [Candidatus Helarchaeota archaeon]
MDDQHFLKELGPDYGNVPILRPPASVKQITTQTTRDGRHWDFVQIPGGSSWTFPELKGPACISTIWFTLSPFRGKSWKNIWRTGNFLLDFIEYRHMSSLRDVWVKIFFDDETSPSVYAPIGNFFGQGFAEYKHYHSQFLGMTSGGYVCFFPMPFASSCRIEIENTNRKSFLNNFYGAVTYTLLKDVEEDVGYFHARYRREQHLKEGEPYVILDATGRGRYIGCNLSSRAHKRRQPLESFFFLEGDCNIYIDGDSTPMLSYTGTEDYFQGAWYYIKGEYCTPTHGCTTRSSFLTSWWSKSKVSAYRFHFPDIISFEKSIKVAINHGEYNQVDADYQSVAYWYQREPHSSFFDTTNGGTP